MTTPTAPMNNDLMAQARAALDADAKPIRAVLVQEKAVLDDRAARQVEANRLMALADTHLTEARRLRDEVAAMIAAKPFTRGPTMTARELRARKLGNQAQREQTRGDKLYREAGAIMRSKVPLKALFAARARDAARLVDIEARMDALAAKAREQWADADKWAPTNGRKAAKAREQAQATRKTIATLYAEARRLR